MLKNFALLGVGTGQDKGLVSHVHFGFEKVM